jgi:hypothetical protein
MFGTRISTASLLFLIGAAAQAADTDYFPLHVGNQWTYQSGTLLGSGVQQQVEVKNAATLGGRAYVLYSGLDGDAYLRQDDNGTLYTYDRNSQSDVMVAPFASDDGAFTPVPNLCDQTGKIASRNAKYKGPIGEFDNALEIRYTPGKCADAGVVSEVYLPWIGLVQRTTTTIAGPRVFDLVYARIGGVTIVSGPETSFGITLDKSVYSAGSGVSARLTLRSTQSDALKLVFSSGQMFDLAIRNEKGDRVYQWSIGRFFTDVVQTVDVQGEKNWTVTAPLGQLPAGKYTAEGWLTPVGPVVWTASAPFEIR